MRRTWLIPLAVLSLAATAQAAQVELSVIDCSLHESELGRLVTLELSDVLDSSDRLSRYRVLVRCDATGVMILSPRV